jgi:hypothetical protein
VNSFEEDLAALSDDELAAMAVEFRTRCAWHVNPHEGRVATHRCSDSRPYLAHTLGGPPVRQLLLTVTLLTMTKRKRPRYGNPARQSQANAKDVPDIRLISPDELRASLGAPNGLNRLARSSCDECGAPVEWVTGVEAEERGVDLAGGMEFLGVTDIPGKDVWLCTNCDNFGIMGPAESDFF